ncbi:hypothetical protein ERJ75_000835900 [Trypanosoma vivax]|uniref:Uncharacterized protein n=1 Tax=Trypanosoma vivax (strain Y486) TaxID=1055687 RepID=G0TYW4_TRYVY|nr:hypothetical protein TRVL_01701 [Trypanosoma vivax]KAH8612959.1 hypothetical protein ERJ75_000835900 [Trypanosoma vivax]CCC49167.1 conserved hypothetical protein [Trypanosoma vivax Y486]
MGLLCNASIFSLLVLPIVFLVRGYRIQFRPHIILIILVALYLIGQSALLYAVTGPSLLMSSLRHLVKVVGVPLMDLALMDFVLNDSKARKRLLFTDDTGAATLVTIWATVDLILFRWFRWYHVMSEPGHDATNLLSAAEAFLSLVGSLLAARRIDKNTFGMDRNGSAIKSGQVTLATVRIGACAFGALLDAPSIGLLLYVFSLLLLRVLFPPTLKTGAKDT